MRRYKLDLPDPKNHWALVIYLLLENKLKGLTMVTAMKDHFHKFQTRLGELEKSRDKKGAERKAKLKIRRLPVVDKNRFGHTNTYTNYKALASEYYLRGLYKKINKEGMHKQKL